MNKGKLRGNDTHRKKRNKIKKHRETEFMMINSIQKTALKVGGA